MEMFNPGYLGYLVFAQVTRRGPPWPAVVTKYFGNQLYRVRCFATGTVADVKATAIVTYSTYSLTRYDTKRNRKIKQFVLALDLIREKREECGCSSGCSVPTDERKEVKLTVCLEGKNEMVDINQLKVVKKGKTPYDHDKTRNKKRKAESMSDEKQGVDVRGMEKEVVVNDSIPREERKKIKLTVCKVDIDKLKVVKKGKISNKKRKAKSVSDVNDGGFEKEVNVNVRGMEKEVIWRRKSLRIASKSISPMQEDEDIEEVVRYEAPIQVKILEFSISITRKVNTKS